MMAVRTPVETDAAIARRLSAHGVQATRQRVRIASVLLDHQQHVNAEQLLDLLRERGIRVSKATVYNTLNLFAARGLVRQLSVDGQRAWFDSNVEPHYHFQQIDNGELTDIPIPEVAFQRLPPPPPGMEVAGIDLVIRLRHSKN
jgi:Fur family transcriptional regulator, iron response regulator